MQKGGEYMTTIENSNSIAAAAQFNAAEQRAKYLREAGLRPNSPGFGNEESAVAGGAEAEWIPENQPEQTPAIEDRAGIVTQYKENPVVIKGEPVTIVDLARGNSVRQIRPEERRLRASGHLPTAA
jgi:hypothetical protein